MRIVLGVSGGVAAYKAVELLRLLQQEGLEVQVVMTRAAQEFVTPLTFAALSGQKVITEMFGAESGAGANVESAIEHIAVAQRIDLLLVAPATADVLARLAAGMANDFLSTLYLATKAPVVVAPAMNVNMWEHAATRENIATLRRRGVRAVEPDAGYLACGMTGAGRLADNAAIVEAVREVLGLRKDFLGQRVLVTAGPTCEALDPVRFLSNRSSGKMGYALADAASRRGARVIVVCGPTELEPLAGAEWILVRTAEEMQSAVQEHFREANVAILAAAVADFRPVAAQAGKIKKTGSNLTLELEPAPDILAGVAREKGARIVVGFAAETDHMVENAREKLARKGADMMVANDVAQDGAGFDVDTNIATLLLRDGREIALGKMTKFELANRILDHVLELRERRA